MPYRRLEAGLISNPQREFLNDEGRYIAVKAATQSMPLRPAPLIITCLLPCRIISLILDTLTPRDAYSAPSHDAIHHMLKG